jgi:hypothetical protein
MIPSFLYVPYKLETSNKKSVFFLPMTFSIKFPFEQSMHLSKPPGCQTLKEGGSVHTLALCHLVMLWYLKVLFNGIKL